MRRLREVMTAIHGWRNVAPFREGGLGPRIFLEIANEILCDDEIESGCKKEIDFLLPRSLSWCSPDSNLVARTPWKTLVCSSVSVRWDVTVMIK